MALKDLTIFGKPAFDTPQTDTTAHSNGALSIIGRTLQGIAAPFGAAYGNDFGIKQMQLQAQQDQADMEFQRYLNAQNMQNNGVPVFTIGEDGGLKLIGNKPKGAQVIGPSTIQTPEQKTDEAVNLTKKKDAAVRAQKLSELNKAIDFFDTKIKDVPGGNGLGGRIQGLGVAVEGALQTNPKVAAYMANVEGLRSQIARGLGEVGNLSEYEQKYAINLLPKVTDNLETRQQKLTNFRDYIKTRLGTGSEEQSFTVKGKTYNIPADQVDAFKKDMGIK